MIFLHSVLKEVTSPLYNILT